MMNLREYKNRPRNVRLFLRLSGLSIAMICPVLAALVPRWNLDGRVFDHARIFGEDGLPAALVGHPYMTVADAEADPIVALLRSHGFVVTIEGRESSLYGYGTCQVIVSGPLRPVPAREIARHYPNSGGRLVRIVEQESG